MIGWKHQNTNGKSIKLHMENAKRYWTIAYWTLLIGWVVGAVLNMAHVHGGFFTNYLADVAFPPWFYIFIRGLSAVD